MNLALRRYEIAVIPRRHALLLFLSEPDKGARLALLALETPQPYAMTAHHAYTSDFKGSNEKNSTAISISSAWLQILLIKLRNMLDEKLNHVKQSHRKNLGCDRRDISILSMALECIQTDAA